MQILEQLSRSAANPRVPAPTKSPAEVCEEVRYAQEMFRSGIEIRFSGLIDLRETAALVSPFPYSVSVVTKRN